MQPTKAENQGVTNSPTKTRTNYDYEKRALKARVGRRSCEVQAQGWQEEIENKGGKKIL